ncbi:hypothetical protein K502DRAFT_346428 [Neoconidiobolus thromboides FSU 785]|nr:hypothetical protein K502DRAFT_346428 [Neoconidiobolus thromboides FSU 785]
MTLELILAQVKLKALNIEGVRGKLLFQVWVARRAAAGGAGGGGLTIGGLAAGGVSDGGLAAGGLAIGGLAIGGLAAGGSTGVGVVSGCSASPLDKASKKSETPKSSPSRTMAGAANMVAIKRAINLVFIVDLFSR